MAGRLDGKTALMTGTSGGRGGAAAELLCAEGASVGVT
jgi:NAD(P)-dependent dehydrogenase (short-subunit alcohol dehydrogenase family)